MDEELEEVLVDQRGIGGRWEGRGEKRRNEGGKHVEKRRRRGNAIE